MGKIACDSCHRRKIRCDATVPQCDWCKHHDLRCSYDRVNRSKKLAANHQDPGLSARISRLEDALAQALSKLKEAETQPPQPPTPSHYPPLSRSTIAANQSPPVTFAKIHFAGLLLGQVSSSSGIPSFSPDGLRWIQSRTGEAPAFLGVDGASGIYPQPSPLPGMPPLSVGSQQLSSWLELPDRKIVLEYHRVFSSVVWAQFPIVDPVLFLQTIDLAYEAHSSTPTVEQTGAKACVFIFLTVMSFLREETSELIPLVDGSECAAKAQYLLPQSLLAVNMVTLQTTFMFAMHQAFCGQVPAAVISHSLACRIAIMLGAHSEPAPRMPSTARVDHPGRTKCHLRDLFWVCYIFDKELSLRAGNPPSIADEHCDLTLPDGYLEAQYVELEDGKSPSVDQPPSTPSFPSDLRLCLIKSKTSKLLYSAEAHRKSDAQLLSDIRELDNELEQWRLSLPAKFRPSLSICREPHLEIDVKPLLSTRIIMRHVNYHYLMVMIHLASGRCSAWANSKGGELEGVSSSLALSVEASRSTLYYLRAANHALFGGAFWLLLFHPISAVTTIFCNLLQNPLDPAAHDDLDLLKTAPDLIRSMRVQQLPHDILHIKQISNFVAELVRLGNFAIKKAMEERNAMDED
ncbi:fungal-specific transcription factor [Dactylonectria macrodidyma]|uniref:Fungal-specific transcription factor n=1 Tax=Dactylonectria macrodidyma TaxID=307937 RepID=A0A9P9FWS7_9HYPO|nr:fungal-specific transcription factor [Dactylonectria macrodidyma]